MSLFDDLHSLEDVQRLIDRGVLESETLDYKRADHALDQKDLLNVARDLSSFANTAGGLTVYGVAADPKVKAKPSHIVPIRAQNVEVILQVPATHIRHPLRGVRSRVLPESGPVQVLLVDVPQSELAPHQVAVQDHRYYRRNGLRIDSMSHDLLELYFGRRMSPVLEPIVALGDVQPDSATGESAGVFPVTISLANNGQRAARDILVRVTIPPDAPAKHHYTHVAAASHKMRDGMVLTQGRSASLVYPGLPVHLMVFDLQIQLSAIRDAATVFFIDAYTDGSQARRYRAWPLPAPLASKRLSTQSLEIEYLGPPPVPIQAHW